MKSGAPGAGGTGRRWALRILGVVGLLLVAIQLVPYGRDHTNPPVVKEPAWDSPTTRELAVRACFDCHSNETRWPWYSHVAPTSWLLQRHVEEGRAILNYSEWNRVFEEAPESAQTVIEGEMPLKGYLFLHPSARLSPGDKDTLVRGLTATFGTAPPEEHER